MHNKAISGSEDGQWRKPLDSRTYVAVPQSYYIGGLYEMGSSTLQPTSISAILEQVFFFTWQFCCNHPQPGISVLKLIGEQDCSWYVPSAHAL